MKAISVKADETYINPDLIYNQRDNTAVGTCLEHAPNCNLKIESLQSIENIKQKIDAREIHIPKECLIMGVNSLNTNSKFEPLIIAPTCSKK